MQYLSNFNPLTWLWGSFSNFKPLTTKKELEKKIQEFVTQTDCLQQNSSVDPIQTIGRRIVQLPNSQNQIKIEYDSGNRLRLSSKIQLDFPYLEMDEKTKAKFNQFLIYVKAKVPFESNFTPTFKYSSAQPDKVVLKCVAYCYDDQLGTPQQFQEILQVWDQSITIMKNAIDLRKTSKAALQLKKRSANPAALTQNDFLSLDKLCLDTFALISGLKEVKTQLELRRNFDTTSGFFKVARNVQANDLKFLGYLSYTESFCPLFKTDIAKQNKFIEAMKQNSPDVLPANPKNKIENNLDSFSMPEYETYNFMKTGVLTSNDLKQQFEQFTSSFVSIRNSF